MKKFACVFALLAVFAMAGTSMAGMIIEVVPDPVNPVPAPGLSAWIVRGVGTEGTLIDTIGTINIHDGLVHNIWAFGDIEGTPTIDEHSSALWDASWAKYDTYRMISGDDLILRIGPKLAETNNGADPVNLGLSGPAGFEMFVPTVGMGTFSQPDDPYPGCICFTGATEIDILHVVTVGQDVVLLDIELFSNGEPAQFTDIPIGVIPEPSTPILLVLGGLCLVGYRLRK